MTNYRVALIGTGRVGYQFSFSDLPDNHAEAVQAHPSCTLVAGVNRGKEKLADFGQRFGIGALYHDYQQMLAEVKPDICIITTHPQLHAEMVAGCASMPSTKAIICEKPMALSIDECEHMIDACQRADVLLQINHNRRWHPEWNLAKGLLDDGAIGQLNHIYCYMDGVKPAPSWTSDYEGPLLHDCTHYFDLMDYFAGPVDWLCGTAEQRRRPWAVEDFASAFLRFKNGASGLLHATELTDYTDHAFELRGEKGVLRIGGEKVQLLESKLALSEPDSGFEWSRLQEAELAHPAPASTYVEALAELVTALEGNGALRSDGEVGRRSLEMVHAVYQSQLEGNRPVHFPVTLKGSGVEALRAAGQFRDRDR
ncbi:MAG: putative dehydrogenase [Candidatus Latescibacterota bacterium]|jgi:predicted dehydrogenase